MTSHGETVVENTTGNQAELDVLEEAKEGYAYYRIVIELIQKPGKSRSI